MPPITCTRLFTTKHVRYEHISHIHDQERAIQFLGDRSTTTKGVQYNHRRKRSATAMACSDPYAAHNMLDLCLLSHAHARVLSLSYISLHPSPQSPWQPRSSPTTPFSKPRDTCGQSGSFKSSREVVNTRPTSHYRSIPSHTSHTRALLASFPPLSRRESSRVFERVEAK